MVSSVRKIENIETGDFVNLKEKLLILCGGTLFRVADFQIKDTNCAV